MLYSPASSASERRYIGRLRIGNLILKLVLSTILAAQREDLRLFFIFIGQLAFAVEDRHRERGNRDVRRVSRKGADSMLLLFSFRHAIKCGLRFYARFKCHVLGGACHSNVPLNLRH